MAGIVVEAGPRNSSAPPALSGADPPVHRQLRVARRDAVEPAGVSKLHVGLLEPRLFPGRAAALDFSLTALLGLVAFTGVGIAGWLRPRSSPGSSPAAAVHRSASRRSAGLFATVSSWSCAYAAASTSFRFGLDPDNHGIPVVTAAMDLAGVLCLVAAIALLRVG